LIALVKSLLLKRLIPAKYSVILRIRIVADSCRENQNTHFSLNNIFFENRALYEKMWKNTVEPDRPQMTIWDKGLQTGYLRLQKRDYDYVMRIAFPWHEWLNERASILPL
jgi:hypothetical protein